MKALAFFSSFTYDLVRIVTDKQAKPKLQWALIISVCADGNLGFFKIHYYHYSDRCPLLTESCMIDKEIVFKERGMPTCFIVWNECCCFLSLDCFWVCVRSLLLHQLKQADRFLNLLTAITPAYGKKQMVIPMEICSTARGVQIMYQWRHQVKCVWRWQARLITSLTAGRTAPFKPMAMDFMKSEWNRLKTRGSFHRSSLIQVNGWHSLGWDWYRIFRKRHDKGSI